MELRETSGLLKYKAAYDSKILRAAKQKISSCARNVVGVQSSSTGSSFLGGGAGTEKWKIWSKELKVM